MHEWTFFALVYDMAVRLPGGSKYIKDVEVNLQESTFETQLTNWEASPEQICKSWMTRCSL